MQHTTLGLLACLLFGTMASAQAVSTYGFSESTETYTPVSGTSSTAVGDDGTQNAIPFGFSFPFGGANYQTFSISTNGFIRLGNDIGDQSWMNALSNNSAHRPLIAVFWDDHNRGNGSINYQVTGNAPDRVAEIGWNNINPSGGGGTSSAFFGSFKMRLHETTGVIEFVYGPVIDAVNVFSASIGLCDWTSFLSVLPMQAGATVSSTTASNLINSSAAVIGRKYTFTPPAPCSGAPTVGNTLASAESVCLGTEVILSMQAMPPASGLAYQWQSSTDGLGFSDVMFEESTTMIAFQGQDTFYRCRVSCGAESSYTVPVLVEMAPIANCYCSPVYTTGMTDGDLISNVEIPGTTLANNTGTAAVNPYYTYFTGQPNYTAELVAGVEYQLHVTVGSYGAQHSAAWIDYNDDAIFSDDERIGYSLGATGAFGTATFPILVSCDAPAGVHRMRIRDVYNEESNTIDPCMSYGYGEVEDYDITILDDDNCLSPFALAVPAVSASSVQLQWTAGCGQFQWNVHVAPAGQGAPSGTASNPNVTTSGIIIPGLAPQTAYEFYVQGNCGDNGLSDWAGPFAFQTMPMAVDNDDCASATTLQVGSAFDDFALVGTNVGATKSIGEPNVTCAIFGFGGDVWYKAIVPESGSLWIETRANTGSTLIDTGLSAYTGTCTGGLMPIGCSDDEGEEGFSMLHLTGLAPGTTVFARVWEYANDVHDTFRIAAYDAALGTPDSAFGNFRLYPNPVGDVLHVSYGSSIDSVRVLNLLGQEVLKRQPNMAEADVDVSGLPSGSYLVRIQSGTQTKIAKIVKR